MKTKLFMNDVVIVSDFTMEDLCKVERFKPEALRITNDENDVEFMVSVDACGHGGASSKCIVFDNAVGDDHKAAVIVKVFEDTIEKKKAYFAENYGGCLRNLEMIEEKVATAIREIYTNINETKNNIETVEI